MREVNNSSLSEWLLRTKEGLKESNRIIIYCALGFNQIPSLHHHPVTSSSQVYRLNTLFPLIPFFLLFCALVSLSRSSNLWFVFFPSSSSSSSPSGMNFLDALSLFSSRGPLLLRLPTITTTKFLPTENTVSSFSSFPQNLSNEREIEREREQVHSLVKHESLIIFLQEFPSTSLRVSLLYWRGYLYLHHRIVQSVLCVSDVYFFFFTHSSHFLWR